MHWLCRIIHNRQRQQLVGITLLRGLHLKHQVNVQPSTPTSEERSEEVREERPAGDAEKVIAVVVEASFEDPPNTSNC
jgi:hypothetical protein